MKDLYNFYMSYNIQKSIIKFSSHFVLIAWKIYNRCFTIFIKYIPGQESGFYVECGALDGEKGSTTLFFEKQRKWNGLLIEADPKTFTDLRSKHRKAFTINACLNPYPYPAKVNIEKHSPSTPVSTRIHIQLR